MTADQSKSNHPYLIFLHGMLGHAEDWHAQVEYFGKNYCVAALDLPGHGHRELIQGAEYNWDIPSLAQDVIMQINALNTQQPIVLIGHSVAARIAIETAYFLKDKLIGLVLLDMGYQAFKPITGQWLQQVQHRIHELGYDVWLQQFFDVKFGSTTPESMRQDIWNIACKIDSSIGISLYLNTLIYDYYALEKTMRWIDAPTLILQSSFYYQGKRQVLQPNKLPMSDWLSLAQMVMPKAQIKLIPNCGHWIMREQVDLCHQLVQSFLDAG